MIVNLERLYNNDSNSRYSSNNCIGREKRRRKNGIFGSFSVLCHYLHCCLHHCYVIIIIIIIIVAHSHRYHQHHSYRYRRRHHYDQYRPVSPSTSAAKMSASTATQHNWLFLSSFFFALPSVLSLVRRLAMLGLALLRQRSSSPPLLPSPSAASSRCYRSHFYRRQHYYCRCNHYPQLRAAVSRILRSTTAIFSRAKFLYKTLS